MWMERENAIVNGIMSGNNHCETLISLANAALEGNAKPLDEFLRGKIRPTLKVCADEAAQKDRDLHAASADSEAKRFALEYIVSNMGGSVVIAEPAIVDAIKKALPGRLI